MSDRFGIILPWPPRPLWANWRGFWRVRADALAVSRYRAKILTLKAMGREGHALTRPMLTFEFAPPSRASRDMQNMPHTQKAAIDGIADALGMDDKHFACVWPVDFSEPVKGGRVVIEIGEWAA